VPTRAAVVLVTAAVAGLTVGGLTHLSTDQATITSLAGLAAFGASVQALNKLIG